MNANDIEDILRFGNECYAKGEYQKALDSYSSAAIEGSGDAAFKLGDMYIDGIGVRPDTKMARDWYIAAARNGRKDADKKVKDIRAGKLVAKAVDVEEPPIVVDDAKPKTEKTPIEKNSPKSPTAIVPESPRISGPIVLSDDTEEEKTSDGNKKRNVLIGLAVVVVGIVVALCVLFFYEPDTPSAETPMPNQPKTQTKTVLEYLKNRDFDGAQKVATFDEKIAIKVLEKNYYKFSNYDSKLEEENWQLWTVEIAQDQLCEVITAQLKQTKGRYRGVLMSDPKAFRDDIHDKCKEEITLLDAKKKGAATKQLKKMFPDHLIKNETDVKNYTSIIPDNKVYWPLFERFEPLNNVVARNDDEPQQPRKTVLDYLKAKDFVGAKQATVLNTEKKAIAVLEKNVSFYSYTYNAHMDDSWQDWAVDIAKLQLCSAINRVIPNLDNYEMLLSENPGIKRSIIDKGASVEIALLDAKGLNATQLLKNFLPDNKVKLSEIQRYLDLLRGQHIITWDTLKKFKNVK